MGVAFEGSDDAQPAVGGWSCIGVGWEPFMAICAMTLPIKAPAGKSDLSLTFIAAVESERCVTER
jgi:hypothetical protein